MSFTRDDVELYMMGEFDGDRAALEKAIAEDPALAAIATGEAKLELLLRDAGGQATFCPACDDLVKTEAKIVRCDACGCAISPGGYVVEQVLVSNAHGRMYVARDADGKQVALKELAFVQSPTLEVIAAFEREAKLLRALEHPAIPRFVASFEEGTGVHTRYYLAQELVSGKSLDARLDDHFYSEVELIEIGKQVLDVLVYLQGVSPMVIHRDIKPANLIYKSDGTVSVVDFGAAHVQGTTAGSTSIGTFGYMPIEQLAGLVDATTDAYALGASLLHLSSRREPWRILQQGVAVEGINVSAAMRGFLAKLVAPEPSGRFATAGAARAALDKIARGEPVNDLALARAKRSGRRWVPPVAIGAAVAVALAGGFGAHALLSGPPETIRVEVPADISILKIELRGRPSATLFVDGHETTTISDGMEVPLRFGAHAIRLVAADGPFCEKNLVLEGNSRTVITCDLPDLVAILPGNALPDVLPDVPIARTKIAHADDEHPNGRFKPDECVRCHKSDPKTFEVTQAKLPLDDLIPAGKPIDLDFKGTPLHDVLRIVGESCGLNLVVPDRVEAKITVKLVKVPCDQALEVLLESQGLWYRYAAAGNMLRVGTRNELDRELDAERARKKINTVDDQLPKGGTMDLDFKDAPLTDLLKMFAASASVNIVIPESLATDIKVTVRLKKAPWDAGLKAMLAAHGLWYRYRPNGKLLRIATRNELDREAEAARSRSRVDYVITPAPASTANGQLVIQSKPRAKIFIDGADTGKTTPATLDLPPGKHRLMLQTDDNKWSWPVTVKPGEVLKMIKDLSS